jgi:hypothetical protein
MTIQLITPGSPGKFLMAAFVRFHAQKVTAEIYPVQPLVKCFPMPKPAMNEASNPNPIPRKANDST